MKQTENLKLNLFESSDPVLAQSFNENSTKVDAAVTEAKALTESRCNALAASAVTVQTGSYTGDGSNSRTLTFQRKPAMVIVQYGNLTLLCIHGKDYAVALNNVSGYGTVSHITKLVWNDAGKSLTLNFAGANSANNTYNWMAFLCDTI